MSIKQGDKIPSITVKRLGASGMEEINLGEYFKGKKAVMFAVPGAFTPTCAQKHLPGYVAKANDIKAQGIDEIVCLSVNDPFVMQHWGEVAGAAGKVTMMPDGNGAFTREIGMEFDGAGAGLGIRSKRYVMQIDDGVVTSLDVEESPGDLNVTGAESCMINLKSAA